jgi:hypothetical protein
MLGCISISFFVSLKPVLFIAAVASAIHVMRQSTGIVALYRRCIGDRDPLRRKHENWAIYSASLACLGVGFVRFYLNPESIPEILKLNLQLLNMITFAAQAAVALCLFACVFLIFSIVQMEKLNFKATNQLSLSRALVFAYSLFLYTPYLFVSRMEHAIAIGVGIHYVQYLGIVWWLNHNKYPDQPLQKDWGLKIMGLMSQSVWARLPYLLGYAVLMLALREYGLKDWTQAPNSWLYAIPVGLQFCHYHLDAYLWRFSNPFVRNTVLKYL